MTAQDVRKRLAAMTPAERQAIRNRAKGKPMAQWTTTERIAHQMDAKKTLVVNKPPPEVHPFGRSLVIVLIVVVALFGWFALSSLLGGSDNPPAVVEEPAVDNPPAVVEEPVHGSYWSDEEISRLSCTEATDVSTEIINDMHEHVEMWGGTVADSPTLQAYDRMNQRVVDHMATVC